MVYFYKCHHKHEFYTFFPFIFGQLAQLFNKTFRFSPRFFIRFRFDFQNKCRRRLAQNHSYPHECLQLFLKVRIWFLESLGRNYDWIEILQKFTNQWWHLTARHGIAFGRKILETKQSFSLTNSLPEDFRQRNRSFWWCFPQMIVPQNMCS